MSKEKENYNYNYMTNPILNIYNQMMESAGYTRFDHMNNINPVTGMPQDDMFVRNDVVTKYGVQKDVKDNSEL